MRKSAAAFCAKRRTLRMVELAHGSNVGRVALGKRRREEGKKEKSALQELSTFVLEE